MVGIGDTISLLALCILWFVACSALYYVPVFAFGVGSKIIGEIDIMKVQIISHQG
jgi:hypothetical protein